MIKKHIQNNHSFLLTFEAADLIPTKTRQEKKNSTKKKENI